MDPREKREKFPLLKLGKNCIIFFNSLQVIKTEHNQEKVNKISKIFEFSLPKWYSGPTEFKSQPTKFFNKART